MKGMRLVGLIIRFLRQPFDLLIGRNHASILMYHAVIDEPLPVGDWCFLAADAFRRQLQYLKKNFEIIPLSEIPSWRRRGKPAAAITFDDGFENNYRIAYPILKELEVPATIFLTTDFIGSDTTIWFCRLNDALSRTQLPYIRFNGRTYELSSDAGKRFFGAAAQAWLKQFPNHKLLQYVESIIKCLGDDPDKAIPAGSPYRMLNPGQIRDMAASGLIDFGAHTASHAILSLHKPKARAREIENSILAVQNLTGRPCIQFAYPNGRACDFGLFDTAVVSASGIKVAVASVAGPNRAGDNHLALRRYGIGGDISLPFFGMQVHHLDYHLRKHLR